MISSEVEKTTKRIAGTDGLQDRKFCIYKYIIGRDYCRVGQVICLVRSIVKQGMYG